MKRNNKLVREQLQTTINKYKKMSNIPIPSKGWIRAIRNALGMSGRQLAERMGVSRQRVSFIEKQEIDVTTTLNTMRRTAEALDSVFVYGIVTRFTLDKIIKMRANQIAVNRLNRVSHTMLLEDQALSEDENKKMLTQMIKEICDEPPSNLWDE